MKPFLFKNKECKTVSNNSKTWYGCEGDKYACTRVTDEDQNFKYASFQTPSGILMIDTVEQLEFIKESVECILRTIKQD